MDEIIQITFMESTFTSLYSKNIVLANVDESVYVAVWAPWKKKSKIQHFISF